MRRNLASRDGARVTPTSAPTEGYRPAVVFVHGLFSSARTWRHFDLLIESDPDLARFSLLHFEYSSPKFNWNPLRRIPDFNVLADNLQTFLETEAADHTDLILVSHSQGGLVVQRFLSRMLSNARGKDLERIRRVVMFACPNSGSEILLAARRSVAFWKNPQERELRPINDSVADSQKIVLSRIIHARCIASDQCPIPIFAYAGESDNIVTTASARGVFPDTGILPGDHFSIIQPNSREHRAFRTLKMNLTGLTESSRNGRAADGLDPHKTTDPIESSSGNELGESDEGVNLGGIEEAYVEQPGPEEESFVIARWNPRHRTIDFILSPDVALSWIKKFGEEDESNV